MRIQSEAVHQVQRTRALRLDHFLYPVVSPVSGYQARLIAIALMAARTFLAWGWFGPELCLVYGLINADAVFFTASPCASGFSKPMSIVVANGKAATQGVLRGRNRTLSQVDTLIVD